MGKRLNPIPARSAGSIQFDKEDGRFQSERNPREAGRQKEKEVAISWVVYASISDQQSSAAEPPHAARAKSGGSPDIQLGIASPDRAATNYFARQGRRTPRTARRPEAQQAASRRLDVSSQLCNFSSMTDRQAVMDALQRLPENASLKEISEELRIMAAVKRGRLGISAGSSKSQMETEQLLESWASAWTSK